MRLEDLEESNGKVKNRPTCDPRLPCHYGGDKSEASASSKTDVPINYGNSSLLDQPIERHVPNKRWNPDGHLGAVEEETYNTRQLSSVEKETLRDYYGFRIPPHFNNF